MMNIKSNSKRSNASYAKYDKRINMGAIYESGEDAFLRRNGSSREERGSGRDWGQKIAGVRHERSSRPRTRDLYCEHCHIEHACVETDSDDTLKAGNLNSKGPMPDLINEYATIPRIEKYCAVNRCAPSGVEDKEDISSQSGASQKSLSDEACLHPSVSASENVAEGETPQTDNSINSSERPASLSISLGELCNKLKLQHLLTYLRDVGCTTMDSLVGLCENDFAGLTGFSSEDRAKIETALQLLDLATDTETSVV